MCMPLPFWCILVFWVFVALYYAPLLLRFLLVWLLLISLGIVVLLSFPFVVVFDAFSIWCLWACVPLLFCLLLLWYAVWISLLAYNDLVRVVVNQGRPMMGLTAVHVTHGEQRWAYLLRFCRVFYMRKNSEIAAFYICTFIFLRLRSLACLVLGPRLYSLHILTSVCSSVAMAPKISNNGKR